MNLKLLLVFLVLGISSNLHADGARITPEVKGSGRANDYIEAVNSNVIPPYLRGAGGGIPSHLQLINRTPWYLCLAWIDPDGNLRHGYTDLKKPGFTVFYVAPGGRTSPNAGYLPNSGDVFAILTLKGDILGYCTLKKGGADITMTVDYQ